MALSFVSSVCLHFCLCRALTKMRIVAAAVRPADAPFKQTCFPQYAVPDALERYAEVADALNLGGKTKEEKVRVSTHLLFLKTMHRLS